MKRIERILQPNEIQENDIVILKYAGTEKKFIVQSIDKFGLKAKELIGNSIRRFPLNQLVLQNWYVERMQIKPNLH